MTKDEALKLALEALEVANSCVDGYYIPKGRTQLPEIELAITAIKEALANEALEKMAENARELGLDYEPAQEPVAWLITDEKINSLQADSIQRLIDRARHAHMTDIKLRINGQDEWYEADWLKHLTRTTPPQRTWTGLTDGEVDKMILLMGFPPDWITENAIVKNIVRNLEAKLKEKNT